MQEQNNLSLTSTQKAEADKLVELVRSFPPDAQRTISGIIAGFRAGMDYQAIRPTL